MQCSLCTEIPHSPAMPLSYKSRTNVPCGWKQGRKFSLEQGPRQPVPRRTRRTFPSPPRPFTYLSHHSPARAPWSGDTTLKCRQRCTSALLSITRVISNCCRSCCQNWVAVLHPWWSGNSIFPIAGFLHVSPLHIWGLFQCSPSFLLNRSFHQLIGHLRSLPSLRR